MSAMQELLSAIVMTANTDDDTRWHHQRADSVPRLAPSGALEQCDIVVFIVETVAFLGGCPPLRWIARFIQGIKHGEALGNRRALISLAVDEQHRNLDCSGQIDRTPPGNWQRRGKDNGQAPCPARRQDT